VCYPKSHPTSEPSGQGFNLSICEPGGVFQVLKGRAQQITLFPEGLVSGSGECMNRLGRDSPNNARESPVELSRVGASACGTFYRPACGDETRPKQAILQTDKTMFLGAALVCPIGTDRIVGPYLVLDYDEDLAPKEKRQAEINVIA
jgi:hypothetical protein